MKMCVDYLQYLFKDNFVNEEMILHELIAQLPRYLVEDYQILPFSLNNKDSYILLESKDKIIISPSKLKKQMIQLYHLTKRIPVFAFKQLRLAQRNALMDANIPFVQPNYQIYIPNIIINLIEKEFIPKESTDVFSTVAQVVFIYLYLNNIQNTNARRLAEALPYSVATTNRALSELVSKNLIYTEGSNTRKKYTVIDRASFWELGKNFLFNPVSASYYTLDHNLCNNLLLSNESALYSFDSNLNETEVVYVACTTSDVKKINSNLLISRYDIIDHPYCVIEKFKYNPKLLNKSNTIDPISLYAQLKDSKDERILIELDDILEGILCYQLPD